MAKNIISKVHTRAAGEYNANLLKVKSALLALIIFAFIILMIHYAAYKRTYNATNADTININYISVPITANDTLWSIADKYYSKEFGTIRDYIKEIKRCNSLESDNIYAGKYIVVPVINEN